MFAVEVHAFRVAFALIIQLDERTTFADPANTFHEKAMLCRAAENTCYFASVNYATPNSPTTSAIARPDGTLLVHQPYGKERLLIADVDLDAATGLLAARCRFA